MKTTFFRILGSRQHLVGPSLWALMIQPPGLYENFIISHVCVCAKSLQSWLTLSDPVDYSPPGSSVHGILQARTLEQAAISDGSSTPLSVLLSGGWG